MHFISDKMSKTQKFSTFALARGRVSSIALRNKISLTIVKVAAQRFDISRRVCVNFNRARSRRLKADNDTPLLPLEGTQFPVFEQALLLWPDRRRSFRVYSPVVLSFISPFSVKRKETTVRTWRAKEDKYVCIRFIEYICDHIFSPVSHLFATAILYRFNSKLIEESIDDGALSRSRSRYLYAYIYGRLGKTFPKGPIPTIRVGGFYASTVARRYAAAATTSRATASCTQYAQGVHMYTRARLPFGKRREKANPHRGELGRRDESEVVRV